MMLLVTATVCRCSTRSVPLAGYVQEVDILTLGDASLAAYAQGRVYNIPSDPGIGGRFSAAA